MQAELQTALFQAFDTLNLQRVKTFSVPPVTLCGLGALSACGQEAQARGVNHLFVMVDSFLHQAGLTAGLARSLAVKGVAMTVWPCPTAWWPLAAVRCWTRRKRWRCWSPTQSRR